MDDANAELVTPKKKTKLSIRVKLLINFIKPQIIQNNNLSLVLKIITQAKKLESFIPHNRRINIKK